MTGLASLAYDAVGVCVAPKNRRPTCVVHATRTPPLFVIADANGRRARAEDAASAAADAFYAAFTWTGDPERICDALRDGFDAANAAVCTEDMPGGPSVNLGTSLTAVALFEASVVIAHAGNVPCHRIRDAVPELLAKPHSVAAELDDAHDEPGRALFKIHHRDILTRALGLASSVDPTVTMHELRPRDVLLLTTDSFRWVADHGAIQGLTVCDANARALTSAIATIAHARALAGAAIVIHAQPTPVDDRSATPRNFPVLDRLTIRDEES